MAKAVVKAFEQHPLAVQLVPGTMSDEEFDALTSDIERRGQRVPAITFEGKLLDGYHRQKACLRLGVELKTEEYVGDDPQGLVIALNVLRRKLGTTQRALAGAKLNLNYQIPQEEASKRVGVSKVHINLVVQALKSNNSRVIKMLENPNMTREQLHEELVESGVIRASLSTPTPPSTLSAAAATSGLDMLFANRKSDDDLEDILGGGDDTEDNEFSDMGDVLGDPPSANGKVINMKPAGSTSNGGMPTVGSRPSHPERRSKETPAHLLAEKFRALTEGDQISFMQLTWHIQRKLLSPAGLSVTAPAVTESETAKQTADKVIAKAAKAATVKAPKAAKGAAQPVEASATPKRARKAA